MKSVEERQDKPQNDALFSAQNLQQLSHFGSLDQDIAQEFAFHEDI